MYKLNINDVTEMMKYVSHAIINNEDVLCEADRNVGDGDHGIGMSKGFKSALSLLEKEKFEGVYDVFSKVGKTLINTMGGASGIIFGLLFYAGTNNQIEIKEIDLAGFAKLFKGSVDEIVNRCKGDIGDKTVIDALSPMVESLEKSARANNDFNEALFLASRAANEGMENTKNFVAKYGKAKSLGERSLGYPDPGAVSVAIICNAMSKWANNNQ